MTTNIANKTFNITRGGDGVARSYDPDGTFRSQIGSQVVTLVPTQNTVVGTPTKVQFAFPFPENECISVSDVKVFNAGKSEEFAIYIEPLLQWQNWDSSPLKSLRGVNITLENTFTDNTSSVDILVVWGEGAATSTLPVAAYDETWVDYRTSGLQWSNLVNLPPEKYTEYDYDGTAYGMPLESIMEPVTWAVLPPKYMKKTGVFGYYLKRDSDNLNLQTCMDFYQMSAKTMTNEVGSHVSEANYTPYMISEGALGDSVEPAHYASWLFDRAAALWGLYAITGNVKDLIQAHRASEFYASKLVNGALSLKPTADLKYTYPKSLVYDVLLTGNVKLLEHIDDIVAFQESWNHVYTYQAGATKLWTERHMAYKLDSLRVAYEVTGSSTTKALMVEVFEEAFNAQQTPQNGWAKDGSIRHTLNSHEAFGGDTPIGSPWMSSLLAGSVKSYYDISGDVRALRLLADLGDWITNYGVRVFDFGNGLVLTLPWYLASDSFAASNASNGYDDPYVDTVHAFDVASLMVKATWAKYKLNEPFTADLQTTSELLKTAAFKFNDFHRTGDDTLAAGKTVYRLAPTRSFNWWFVNGFDTVGLMEIVDV